MSGSGETLLPLSSRQPCSTSGWFHPIVEQGSVTLFVGVDPPYYGSCSNLLLLDSLLIVELDEPVIDRTLGNRQLIRDFRGSDDDVLVGVRQLPDSINQFVIRNAGFSTGI